VNGKLISIVTPCYNEEGNVRTLNDRVKDIFKNLDGYEYEHIFADNCSEDNTLALLKEMANVDNKVKVISNAKNFGPNKSVYNAITSASGDAVIILVADLQDPPELISEFIKKWEEGYKVVFGVRENRKEMKLITYIRKLYYRILKRLSDDDLVNDAGEFVLFDKDVLEILKRMNDNNPYIRGLLASIGFERIGVKYNMKERHAGKSSMNFFSLFIYALNGFVNHTMFPLRIATLIGMLMALSCFVLAICYLILSLIYWNFAPPGIPTLIVGLFFLSGVQLFLIGFLGEFIGSIHKQIKGLPLVIEKERINFNEKE